MSYYKNPVLLDFFYFSAEKNKKGNSKGKKCHCKNLAYSKLHLVCRVNTFVSGLQNKTAAFHTGSFFRMVKIADH
jgi:hypothetical protein